MSPNSLRRTLPALTLLTALLVTPSLAQARPARSHGETRPAATTSSSFFSDLWHLLTRMWGAEGGSIDPWGVQGTPHSGGSSPSGDSGVTIDPNG